MVILELLFSFAFPLFFVFVGLVLGGIGLLVERRHDAELVKREAQVSNFLVWDLKSTPPGMNASAGQLVSGSVVMGTGYIRQFFASFKTLLGGAVKGYQKVLTRARREAQMRMIETAIANGASGIINVRFETSELGNSRQPISELFCYGTMVR